MTEKLLATQFHDQRIKIDAQVTFGAISNMNLKEFAATYHGKKIKIEPPETGKTVSSY